MKSVKMMDYGVDVITVLLSTFTIFLLIISLVTIFIGLVVL